MSIAEIISSPSVVPGHVEEIRGGAAVAAHVAHVDGVGEDLVVQGGLDIVVLKYYIQPRPPTCQ